MAEMSQLLRELFSRTVTRRVPGENRVKAELELSTLPQRGWQGDAPPTETADDSEARIVTAPEAVKAWFGPTPASSRLSPCSPQALPIQPHSDSEMGLGHLQQELLQVFARFLPGSKIITTGSAWSSCSVSKGNLNLLIAHFSILAMNSIGSESCDWDKGRSFCPLEWAEGRFSTAALRDISPFLREQNRWAELCSFLPIRLVLKKMVITLKEYVCVAKRDSEL